MGPKNAWEIEKDPGAARSSRPDPPVSKGLGFLMVTEGPKMEILTRANRPIVRAIDAGTVYVMRYRSAYIQARREQIERLAVSNDGQGRDELIRMIDAGGKLPDAYYQQSTGPKMVDWPVEDDR